LLVEFGVVLPQAPMQVRRGAQANLEQLPILDKRAQRIQGLSGGSPECFGPGLMNAPQGRLTLVINAHVFCRQQKT